MAYKIFIDGREGTTGLRIVDYLKEREDVKILYIEEDKRKDVTERLRLIEESDITILCLPDEASREIVSLAPKGCRILDASTAHRVNPDWVYGLPELCPEQEEKIREANRVSVPGCHATGFILLVRPLVEAGIAESNYPFTCHSVTGYSGGGKKMIAEYENKDRLAEYDSPRQYGLSQKHKHLPEMTRMAGLSFAPVFNPIVSGYYSGMTVSIPLIRRLLRKKEQSPDTLRKMFLEYYKGKPMIEVLDGLQMENGFLCANALSGKNTVQICLYGNEENIMLAARYDNLGKGASGGAVQCMNLMLGEKEEKGLL